MDDRLRNDITDRLIRDYGLKRNDMWLQQGACPNCGKKELFTSAEHPWVVRCGRLNKCGYEGHVRDLYSDLFDNWSSRFPAAPTNPHAAADAYLRDARGFDLARLTGAYTQEYFWDRKRNLGTATVRFELPGVGFWERFIDQPQRFGSQKANFRGAYGGTWWVPPAIDLSEAKEIWITEGIFDASALCHHDIVAVSILSSVNYPAKALEALAKQFEGRIRPALVFALDGDKSGRSYTKKWVARADADGWYATAAQIRQTGRHKRDWNDQHIAGRLEAEHIKEYRHQGALLIARTAAAKADLIYSHTGLASFPLEHDNRIYWYKLDLARYGKASDALRKDFPDKSDEEIRDAALKESGSVVDVCNRSLTALYYLKSEVTDEAWYYFRIDSPDDDSSVKGTFTAAQLAAPAEFKKRLLHLSSGGVGEGDNRQLDSLLKNWWNRLKRVETIDFTGYSIQHGCYVYNDVAVAKGQVVQINDEDYFDLGKLAIKSLSQSTRLEIDADLKGYRTDWFEKLYLCFGARGVVALAFWLGSLFAEQIRRDSESFPFIEIVGEPGAGKTTLIETLWKLLGRSNYEGFDPMKGSMVGFLRSMAQVANLPVVLIESDRSPEGDSSGGRFKQGFHWDSLKSLYNGGSLRTTGVKSAGNDTYDPKFRGSLVISQNAQVQASTAIMERIVHLHFDKAQQSDRGRDAALELRRVSAKEMSGFLVKATTSEAEILAMISERSRPYEIEIQAAGARNPRIQKNHAQLMSCIDALSVVCPVSTIQQDGAKALVREMAIERERALSRDNPLVDEFWEACEFIGLDQLNHSSDPSLIAINLNRFAQLASDRRQQIPLMTDLKRVLKTSTAHAFVDVRTVHSALHARLNAETGAMDRKLPQTVRAWVFKAK